jgi:hypothetical protein
MTELNTELGAGPGGGDGLGAALHGSSPSYALAARGFVSTNEPLKFPGPEP